VATTHANTPVGVGSKRCSAPLGGVIRRYRISGRFPLLLSLALLIALSGLLPALAPIAQAQTGELQIAYIPWVPNGESIGGQGPWYGLVSFQNRSDDFCSFQVYVVAPDKKDLDGDGDLVEPVWTPTAGVSLKEWESRSLSVQGMSLPEPGSPVRLEAACDFSVSLKQYTPNVRRTPWSDGSQVVTGYAALSDTDMAVARATDASAWFLPIVQTNSDWNTFLRIANFAEANTSVTVEIYPSGNIQGAGGATLSLDRQLRVTESWTIDVLSALGVNDFVGFARITASADIGVVAQRVKPGAMMAITNVAVAVDGNATEGSYRSAAPLLFTDYNGWNTGITLANPSQQPANVTLQYFPTDGEMLREESIVIAPRDMQYIYTPGTVDQEGFVGSATILSNVPIVAAIDEVKYETSEALSYMASGAPQHVAGVPIVFKEDPPAGLHDNSGVSIVNLDPVNEQVVRLRVRSRAGAELLGLPLAIRLPAGGSSFIYLPFIDEIPAGTNGSLTIETDSEAGFVAISNDVNYAAGGDGSVVFLAAGNGGVYHIPVPAQ